MWHGFFEEQELHFAKQCFLGALCLLQEGEKPVTELVSLTDGEYHKKPPGGGGQPLQRPGTNSSSEASALVNDNGRSFT
ncbi:hypothetical protein SKAU_G00264080 [Synaphobranchus kaupii]|uniref:Uncharacterized protein n=1 Tax=Synaphobranchus kaupii TaxID=118154 RepID=A0A9Q1IPZ4_SYNKA|nr:hypothetical protein SKAU_G00264080 [Synaphobranchus kaupii]